MVAIAPLVRRYRFIPERITLHAEELAYLWQRRRASLRAPDITLPDFTYLQERIEAEKAQLAKLKVQHAVSPVENPSIIKKNRRDIARMLTVLRQKNAK